ncbi:MAG: HD domain-containing protein [Isosphaeraceae bacterium]
MRWNDRVYGDVAIEEPGILDLIGCPTFQRLKGIRQAGPSALAFPFKNVTRFEHCVGVYLLLRRLAADPREQAAGLLHDVSHTAFSHAVDFVVSSKEQDHHEQLKPLMLERPDIVAALGRLGYAPRDFYDDSIYPLLEQPLPSLCADRLDYFLRDGLACGVVRPDAVDRILGHLAVWDDRMVLTDIDVAREAVSLFKAMNRDWWAGQTEAFIYNEFADALREGLRLGVLTPDDLLTEDDLVLAKLDAAGSPSITRTLAGIRHFRPESARGYVPRVAPKERWIDPLVRMGRSFERLSTLDGQALRPDGS